MVHAPAGGTVTYTYGNASHRTGAVTTLTRVVATRTLGGRGIPAGTWTYVYDQGANQDQTVVNGPCNTTRYRFRGHGLSGDFSAWSAGALEERTTESGIAVVEREVISYVRSEPISSDYVPGEEGIAASNGVYNALVSERVLTRGTASWTTGYVYAVGQGTFNDYGQPTTVTEFENPYSLRETIRTFAHSFTPYIRGRVASARVRVRTAYDEFSGPFEISWTYDPATGFLTRENRGGLVRTFEPDATGNLAAVEDALGHRTTLQYTWGRVRETRTDHVTVTATVNPDGTVAAEGIGDLGTAYTYDDAFRLASATPTNTTAVLYGYDDTDGEVVTVSRGSATARTHVDGFGRPVLTTAADGVLVRTDTPSAGRSASRARPTRPALAAAASQ